MAFQVNERLSPASQFANDCKQAAQAAHSALSGASTLRASQEQPTIHSVMDRIGQQSVFILESSNRIVDTLVGAIPADPTSCLNKGNTLVNTLLELAGRLDEIAVNNTRIIQVLGI